jgi:hypothetical protein
VLVEYELKNQLILVTYSLSLARDAITYEEKVIDVLGASSIAVLCSLGTENMGDWTVLIA